MTLQNEKNMNKSTMPGLVAALCFGCGPFLYLNLFGRGLFLYIAAIFLVALCVQAWKYSAGKLKVNVCKTDKIFYGLVVWHFVTILWAPNKSLNEIYAYVKVVLFFIIISLPYYTLKDKMHMTVAVVLIAAYSSFYMLTTDAIFSEMGIDEGRKTLDFFGIKQDPNYICFLFIFPFIYCLSLMLEQKKSFVVKLASVGVVAVIFGGVVVTGSRGGLIALLAASMVYAITYQKQKIKTLFVLIIIAILLVVLFQNMHLYLPENIVERFSVDTVLSTGGSKRSSIWTNYLNVLFKDPISVVMGYGYGAGAYMIGGASHNYWIDNLFNYGLIGTGIVIWFWGAVLIKLVKQKNWALFSSTCGVLVLATTLSVGSILQFWLAISIINILSKREV